MNVRMAEEKDIPRIHELLSQVAMVHTGSANIPMNS